MHIKNANICPLKNFVALRYIAQNLHMQYNVFTHWHSSQVTTKMCLTHVKFYSPICPGTPSVPSIPLAPFVPFMPGIPSSPFLPGKPRLPGSPLLP